MARFLWRQGTGPVTWDTSSSSVLARETRVQQHQKAHIWSWFFFSVRLPQDGAAKGLGNDLVQGLVRKEQI